MVNFEDGTLVKGAYVLIDGVEHPVIMPQYSGKTPLSSENMNKIQNDILQVMFPVGSKYVTQTNINPSEILGFGIWERFNGKLAIGLDEIQEDFDTIGKTGGEKQHTLTENELPSIVVAGAYNTEGKGWALGDGGTPQIYTQGNTIIGSGHAHNNMPPYEVVGYVWIRRG